MSYFEVKPLTMLFLCSYTRLSKLLVTPIPVFTRTSIQCPIPLTCQNIYKIFIKHKPFSSQVEDKSPIQVEDKSGFPLKTCGNDKPYIFMSTYLIAFTIEGALKSRCRRQPNLWFGLYSFINVKSRNS